MSALQQRGLEALHGAVVKRDPKLALAGGNGHPLTLHRKSTLDPAKAKPSKAKMAQSKPAKSKAAAKLFTIGYEKSKPDALMAELKRAKVKLLVDTRAVAASRKPGAISKTSTSRPPIFTRPNWVSATSPTPTV